MIRFEQVSKTLADTRVLDQLDFEIKRGETFVIVGASGSGKSVTIKHMVRLMTPDEGRVHVGDETISTAKGQHLEDLRERFGYLFQGGALLAWLSIVENVALPLREKTRMSEREILERAQHVLELVGLENDGDKRPEEVSGGMHKRAGLARAIVRNPEIVLYDEPTSGLDPVTARTIDTLIESLRASLGVTSVVVTHDLHSALSIGTRIGMLHEGTLSEVATPDRFIQSERPEVKAFLKAQYITDRGVWEQ